MPTAPSPRGLVTRHDQWGELILLTPPPLGSPGSAKTHLNFLRRFRSDGARPSADRWRWKLPIRGGVPTPSSQRQHRAEREAWRLWRDGGGVRDSGCPAVPPAGTAARRPPGQQPFGWLTSWQTSPRPSDVGARPAALRISTRKSEYYRTLPKVLFTPETGRISRWRERANVPFSASGFLAHCVRCGNHSAQKSTLKRLNARLRLAFSESRSLRSRECPLVTAPPALLTLKLLYRI